MDECGKRKLVVCIQDVTPRFRSEIDTLVRAVYPYVGEKISFAVVPNWHGLFPLSDYPDFLSSLSFSEVLLHGYFHERRKGRSIMSYLTDRADEMNGIADNEIDGFLQAGQDMLQKSCGIAATGFLPPAWQPGCLRRQAYWQDKLHFLVRYSSLARRDETDIPLCTWTWDTGVSLFPGYVGDCYGRIRSNLPDTPVHVLALHPRDTHNRFLNRALALLQELLSAAYTPHVFCDLL